MSHTIGAHGGCDWCSPLCARSGSGVRYDGSRPHQGAGRRHHPRARGAAARPRRRGGGGHEPARVRPRGSKVYKRGRVCRSEATARCSTRTSRARPQDDLPSGPTDRIDALRAIVYVGYKFSDRILFNSEIEFEHGSTEDGGSVSVEFAYLDYRAVPSVRRSRRPAARADGIPQRAARAADVPRRAPAGDRAADHPVDLARERHRRLRRTGRLTYRAYLVNGFDATGFTAGGPPRRPPERRRSDGGELRRRSAGWTTPECSGSRSGPRPTSATPGRARRSPRIRRRTIGAQTFIWEGHAEYKARGFDLRAAPDRHVDDAAEINELNGLSGASSVGERMLGWYLQGGTTCCAAAARTRSFRTFATNSSTPRTRFPMASRRIRHRSAAGHGRGHVEAGAQRL